MGISPLFHIFLNLDRRFWNQILTFVEKKGQEVGGVETGRGLEVAGEQPGPVNRTLAQPLSPAASDYIAGITKTLMDEP